MHLSEQQLLHYQQRALPPRELLAASDHLTECHACRARLHVHLALARPLHAAHQPNGRNGSSGHPTHERLADFIDEALDAADRARVAGHLAHCRGCAAAAAALGAFRTEMLSASARHYEPGSKAPGWWARLGHFWPPVMDAKVALSVLGAATAALVLALFLWRRAPPVGRPPAAPGLATGGADKSTSATSLAQGADVVAMLRDGERLVTLDRQGNVRGLDPAATADGLDAAVKAALTTHQLVDTSPRLASVSGGADTADPHGTFALVSPVGTLVESDRPTFRWRPHAEATSYVVTIMDAGDFSGREATRSESLTPSREGGTVAEDNGALTWNPPPGAAGLARDQVYRWQVTAFRAEREIARAPAAKFAVLPREKADEFAVARQRFTGEHFSLGLLATRAGLLDEAEREFRALRDANAHLPAVREIAEQLRANAETLRR